MGESVSWLNKIEPEIVKAAGVAPSTRHFSFPIEKFTHDLSLRLNIDGLSVKVGLSDWKSQNTFLNGLGTAPVSFSLQLAPLDGDLFFVMAYDDVVKLISWMRDQSGKSYTIDHPDLIKGVYRYAFLEAVSLCLHLHATGDLTPRLTENRKFEERAYVIDLSLQKGKSVIWTRLLLSETLKRSLENHLALKNPTLADIPNLSNVSVPLSFQMGSISLTSEELESLKKGDVIVVENAHYRPSDDRGSLKLVIGDAAVFQVKMKEGKLKILDYIYSYGGKTT